MPREGRERDRKVGKSYGGEAIKVEPRSLERLPLPDNVVKEQRLDQCLSPKQGLFAFDEEGPLDAEKYDQKNQERRSETGGRA
jgi:hypothetical protein